MDKFDLQRQYYPVLAHRSFLNTAQNGLIPSFAADAMCAYVQGRSLNALDLDSMNALWDDADAIRAQIGRVLRCGADEICFGASSSDLFNIFSNGIDLRPGDNVITYDSAYHSTLFTWYNKQAEGVEVRIAKNVDGAVPVETLTALCDERTRAISVCMVDYGTGYRHDLAALGRFCRSRGIYLAVDATQACGAMAIDVEEMQIDFLTTSVYKWLQGCLGLGFAYIHRPLLDTLKQTDMGWTNVRDKRNIHDDCLDLSPDANRFEYGGISFVALAGLKKVLDAYLRLGGQDIEARILSLVQHAYDRAAGLRQVRVLDFAPEHRSGIVMVLYPEDWPITPEYLYAHALGAMPFGKGRCRIAMHYYNSMEDVDRFFDMLAELDAQ